MCAGLIINHYVPDMVCFISWHNDRPDTMAYNAAMHMDQPVPGTHTGIGGSVWACGSGLLNARNRYGQGIPLTIVFRRVSHRQRAFLHKTLTASVTPSVNIDAINLQVLWGRTSTNWQLSFDY